MHICFLNSGMFFQVGLTVIFFSFTVTPVKSYSDPEVISTKHLDRIKTMIQGLFISLITDLILYEYETHVVYGVTATV